MFLDVAFRRHFGPRQMCMHSIAVLALALPLLPFPRCIQVVVSLARSGDTDRAGRGDCAVGEEAHLRGIIAVIASIDLLLELDLPLSS